VATSVVTHHSLAASKPVLHVSEALVQAKNLFPTSSADPDPTQVAQGVLPLADEAPKRLTAVCTNCAPGSPEDQQFHDLVVEFRAPDGPAVYRGPLDQLDTTVMPGAVIKVWLADSGKPQAQGVTSEWSFTATPAPTAPALA
jgi:hypothetical protein